MAATEAQGSLWNFCENKPETDGRAVAQRAFLGAGIEQAAGLISNSATF